MLTDQTKEIVIRLTEICEKLARGDYNYAGQLFELTRNNRDQPRSVSKLAESFGLMLVKIEGREFLLKKTIDKLTLAKHELEQAQNLLKTENRNLKERLTTRGPSVNVIAQSDGMRRIMAQVGKVADTSVSVLLTGETGTGKEVVAKELHNQSSRNAHRFVSLNCSAIPESLVESELFGIEKGVASGVSQRIGKIEQADKGTLFLDEIGDMPMSSQVKILRVLEEREVERVGGDRPIPVDIRVVAATNRDLIQEIDAKRFRSDLYYRLKVVHLDLPPLCHRKEDIIPLCRMFIRSFSEQYDQDPITFEREVADCFERYPWPGNIRELRNEIERLVALASSDKITLADLPDSLKKTHARRDAASSIMRDSLSLEEVEREHIERVLDAVDNNKSRAARVLGISREGLRKKMQRINLVP
jgi:transcriptional regulator with PAS, ATPase and Fis domain